MTARHAFDIGDEPSRHVLHPWCPAEAMTIAAAARIMCQSPANVRKLCARYDLGRRVNCPWLVSRVAVLIFIEGYRRALRAYHDGDRTSTLVVGFYRRCGIAPPVVEQAA